MSRRCYSTPASLSSLGRKYAEFDDLDQPVSLVADAALVALHEGARFALEGGLPGAELAGLVLGVGYFLELLVVGRTLHAWIVINDM